MTSRIIGIVSGKGGVGKTVTTINLGLALHQLGENVTIVDTDTTVANLGLQMGICSFPTTLQDVLKGTDNINKAVYTHPLGLNIIPSSISLDSINADLCNLKHVLNDLDGLVLLDSPPGLSADALSVLDACDEVIIVSTPELQTMANALKVARVALNMEKLVLGIIVNRYTHEKYELNPTEIVTMCDAPILSMIPEDINVKRSLFEKTPLISYSPYSGPSIEFQKLACDLAGQQYRPPKNIHMKKFIAGIKTLMG